MRSGALFGRFLETNNLYPDHTYKLKDKSGVGIIVDYSRDYTGVNGVVLFPSFSVLICETTYFNLLRSAK